MKKRIVIAIVVIAVVAITASFAFGRRRKSDNGAIHFSGNVEVVEVDLSFRVPGRMISRPVDEGMKVAAGTVVATLDPRTFEEDVASRTAALEAAKAQLLELEHGSRPEEIRTARAALAAAETEANHAAVEETRARNLYQDGVLPKQNYDVATATAKMAAQKAVQAREALQLTEAGPRSEKIQQARAAVAQASAALDTSKTQLSFTTLTSPVNGIVLSKHSEAGEQVAAGTPVVTLADLQNVWVRGYVDETDLGRIKLGQKVNVTTDTYPGKVYPGVISFISSEAEFTPKSVQTQKERVKLVYRIKVTVDNRAMELKPGMPADGVIQ